MKGTLLIGLIFSSLQQSLQANCGAPISVTVNNRPQKLQTPKWPRKYGKKHDCLWEVTSDKAGFWIEFLVFNIEGEESTDVPAFGEGCEYDWFEITKISDDGTEEVMEKRCGHFRDPPSYFIPTKKAKVVFITDNRDLYPGADARIFYCDDQPQIENGQTQFEAHDEGDLIRVTCDPGYSLEPPTRDTMMCNERGSWGVVPQCAAGSAQLQLVKIIHSWEMIDDPTESPPVPVKCHRLPPIMHGNLIPMEEENPGTHIEVSCDEGYELTEGQPPFVTCENGVWSHSPEDCVPVKERVLTPLPQSSCDIPPEILHGKAIPMDHLMGLVEELIMSVECDCSYVPIPPDLTNITCTPEHGWSLPPLCAKECEPLTVPHTNVQNHVGIEGDTVSIACSQGYGIDCLDVNTIVSTCHADGKWSPLPVCSALEQGYSSSTEEIVISEERCSDLVIMNAMPEVATGSFGTKVTVVCEPGYRTDTGDMETETECQLDGSWSRTPVCLEE